MWLVAALASLGLVLVSVCILYNARARKALQHRAAVLEREPGTNVLRGAGPLEIDRGRDRACLLIHGFMSTPAIFGALPGALDSAGWDVHAPLLPGHGTDPRQLLGVTSGDWVAHVQKRLGSLQARYDRVVLIGFSMGGSLATIAAEEGKPDGLVLINPYLASTYRPRYVLPPRWWHRLLAPLVDYAVRPSDMINVNRREAIEHIICYRVVPTPAFGELFQVADRALGHPPARASLLVLISQADDTACPQATRRFFQQAATPEKELVSFPRSNHVLLWDYDREEAIQAILTFLERIEPERPTGDPPEEGKEPGS